MTEQYIASPAATAPRPEDRGADPHAPAESSVSRQPWPSPARAWYGVGVFALMLMIVFMNGGVLNLLVDMIKRDLHLTDTQVSFIIGFSSACAAFLSLPVSRLIDTLSRKLIIGTGLVIVSLATLASGLAHGFAQLFVARLLGGAGASGNGPATFSILADYFPPAKLPKAISVMNIGFVYGGAASQVFGGLLIALVLGLPAVTLPIFGTLHAWQIVFLFIAIPEVLLAILVLATVHEPPRRGVRAGAAPGTPGSKAVPVREVFRFLFANRKAFGPMFLGLAVSTLALGTLAWVPAFYMRTYGWTPAQYGVTQGIITMIISPIGLIGGGLLAEWLAKKGYDDANLRVVFISMVAHTPFAVLYPLMPTPTLALAVAAVNTTLIGAAAGPQNAALQVIVPNEMRGQITALFLFIFSLIGLGLGPTVVALLTDYVFGADSMVRYSILTVNATVGVLGSIIFWLGMKPYGEAFARARSWH
jgi:MFS family permease